jgi:glycosyltransferase involved in cell wall biosynthesis
MEDLKKNFPWKIILGYVWRLYKWKNVENLIKAFQFLENENLQLVIVWDWEDYNNLKLKAGNSKGKIYFTWWKTFEEALFYQKQFDIHIHPSSSGWWLATTLLQAMYFGCMIVATPYEWAKEIIINWKNWILVKDDSVEKLKKWILEWLKILKNNEILANFRKENEKIIREKFVREKNIKKLYELVR